jgi:hypothetical protein
MQRYREAAQISKASLQTTESYGFSLVYIMSDDRHVAPVIDEVSSAFAQHQA